MARYGRSQPTKGRFATYGPQAPPAPAPDVCTWMFQPPPPERAWAPAVHPSTIACYYAAPSGSVQPFLDLRWDGHQPDTIDRLTLSPAATPFLADTAPLPDHQPTDGWRPIYPDRIDRWTVRAADQPFWVGTTDTHPTDGWRPVFPDRIWTTDPFAVQRQPWAGVSSSLVPPPGLGWGAFAPERIEPPAYTVATQPTFTTGATSSAFPVPDLSWEGRYDAVVPWRPALPSASHQALALDPFPRPALAQTIEWAFQPPDPTRSVWSPPSAPAFLAVVAPTVDLAWAGQPPDLLRLAWTPPPASSLTLSAPTDLAWASATALLPLAVAPLQAVWSAQPLTDTPPLSLAWVIATATLPRAAVPLQAVWSAQSWTDVPPISLAWLPAASTPTATLRGPASTSLSSAAVAESGISPWVSVSLPTLPAVVPASPSPGLVLVIAAPAAPDLSWHPSFPPAFPPRVLLTADIPFGVFPGEPIPNPPSVVFFDQYRLTDGIHSLPMGGTTSIGLGGF